MYCVSLALPLFFVLLVNTQIIDLFSDVTDINLVNGTVSRSIDIRDSINVIGGTRRLTATFQNNPMVTDTMSCNISDGVFSHLPDNTTFGDCVIEYNGPTFTGFSPVDFNVGGCDCWNLHASYVDAGLNVSIKASTSNGDLISSVSINSSIPSSLDICLPFDSSRRNDYTTVTGLEVALSSEVGGASGKFEYACCQPRVSCWHTIESYLQAKSAFYQKNDTILLTVFCENYMSYPETTEDINVILPFDNTFGSMEIGSINCTSLGVDGEIEKTQLEDSFKFKATLGEGEQVSCSVKMRMIQSGSEKAIAAIIKTSSNPDNPIFSTDEINRQGTVDFCQKPILSSLKVLACLETGVAWQECDGTQIPSEGILIVDRPINITNVDIEIFGELVLNEVEEVIVNSGTTIDVSSCVTFNGTLVVVDIDLEDGEAVDLFRYGCSEGAWDDVVLPEDPEGCNLEVSRQLTVLQLMRSCDGKSEPWVIVVVVIVVVLVILVPAIAVVVWYMRKRKLKQEIHAIERTMSTTMSTARLGRTDSQMSTASRNTDLNEFSKKRSREFSVSTRSLSTVDK